MHTNMNTSKANERKSAHSKSPLHNLEKQSLKAKIEKIVQKPAFN